MPLYNPLFCLDFMDNGKDVAVRTHPFDDYSSVRVCPYRTRA
jgi:hypothetical protein